MSIVRRVPFFDIQNEELPVIVAHVLWGYFSPVQNDACHSLTINDLEEQLADHSTWEETFNERVNNPMGHICLNPESREWFMKREKKPTLKEGFEEFKNWAFGQGIANDEQFIVAMWW